jgi:NADH-quinone oxidoreductase subunit L
MVLPDGAKISATLLSILGIAIFCAAAAASAQFPLQVWLADAMESPCPASALLCGGTFVGAGGYMIGRLFPILTPDAKLFIAIIGLITLAIGALCALAQTVVKKLLACAAMSQLGFIMLALGIGSWTGGLFHLITLAFFQTLLILAAGSVVRATHQQRDLRQFGGLLKSMPVTAATFAVGILAISQTPLFSGYYSGGMILAHAGAFVTLAQQNARHPLYRAFFIVPAVAAYLTPFYMMRCWMLMFWGQPRNAEVHAAARESTTLWLPLLALCGLSVLGGSQILDVKVLLQQSAAETEHYMNAIRDPAAAPFTGFAQAWPVDLDQRLANPDETRTVELQPIKNLEDAGEKLHHAKLAWAFAIGIAAAFLLYCFGTALPDSLLRFPPFRMIHAWLRHRMFFDDLYASVFVAVTLAVGELCALIDTHILEGALNYPLRSLRPAKAPSESPPPAQLEENRPKA